MRKLNVMVGVVTTLILCLIVVISFDKEIAQAQEATGGVPAMELAPSALITPTVWTPPELAYCIGVVADGIHVLSYSDLQKAGLPVDSLDPRTFRLFYMGQELAIQVDGEADGHFDVQDSVSFYGRSVDSLYYEGALPTHKYTGKNIYWLSYGGPNGLRMVTQETKPSGVTPTAFLQVDHQEQQKQYITQYPRYLNGALFNPADDHWFWYKLQIFGTPGSKTQNINFVLNNVANGAFTGALSVRVVGGYDNKHGLRLRVNNNVVFTDTVTWRSFEPFTALAKVPQNYFVNGTNVVQVEMFNVDGTISENYIDWVEIRYYKNHVATNDQLTFRGETGPGTWRYAVSNYLTNTVQLYDITDWRNVQRIVPMVSGTGPYTVAFATTDYNHQYLAVATPKRLTPASIEQVSHLASPYTPSGIQRLNRSISATLDLLDPQNSADWIVITHRDFWTTTLPLAEYRAKHHRVAVVDVQEIYDHFNGGMMSAEAIRDFLAYANQNWLAPAPHYVLLAGGGTSDMRRYFPNSKITYVPTLIYPADPILGETAADNRLVTFLNNDIMPDMAIGRFPVYSLAGLTTMISKTLHYEATPPFNNDWNTHVLFTADDLEGGGGNFYQFSDTLADGSFDPNNVADSKFLPNPYTALKVYLGQTCDLTNPVVSVECRAKVADAINNEGALLVSYVGHAQTNNWTVEKLMDMTLADSLTNWDKLSIFLPMACFEGFFHQPAVTARSLAEAYLLNAKGGAVASWSPTGFGVATGHDWLEQGFFKALFHDGYTTLGDTTLQGKAYLFSNAPAHKYDDLLDTYNLLGDPALQIQTYVAPTAVDVANLRAQKQDTAITISWQSNSEADIVGFNLYRRDSLTGTFTLLNTTPILANGSGSPAGFDYTYDDTTAQADAHYWYGLTIVRLDGSTEAYGIADVNLQRQTQRVFLPVLYVTVNNDN